MLRNGFIAFLCLTGAALAQPADHPPVPKPPLHTCSSPDLIKADKPVAIGFRIGVDGTVTELTLVGSSGSPAADLAALACVKNWTYEPALRDGNPVAFAAKVLVQQNRLAAADSDWRPNVAMTNVTPEIAKALDHLIRDAQWRCQALYRVWIDDYDTPRARSRVVARRRANGEIETAITKSSPMLNADKYAQACVRYMIGKHEDLPPVFSVEIEIDWALYYE